MKSYGRAPTFLLATGYEQVRLIVAELVGDHASALKVQLVLPETGVCTTRPATSKSTVDSCCSAPRANLDAYCAEDEKATAADGKGWGCGTSRDPIEAPVAGRVPAVAE